ncbi:MULTISPECIES: hypothetical protein [unclassified Amycolatopsis]|uniref:hypothetical protein n=1 Tax=unclassified Amycolatopsis TaxID=2618356 RepID=UPI002E1EA205|nr:MULTISPECIES: hypothetical protein [unclassified Amycolatopsis]
MGVYEVFSLLSGIILVGAACVPKLKASQRFWAAVGGAGLIVYAIYVANQTRGTFVFPAVIFVIPVVAIGYLVLQAIAKTKETGSAAERPSEERN